MIITFFGHSDTPYSITPIVEKTLRILIESNEKITCYVGTHGNFDGIVRKILAKLSTEYPGLSYYIVLAYLPKNKSVNPYEGLPTTFPEGIEFTPPKFAISYRNNWMLNQSDIVICYTEHEYGGAASFVKRARKKGKTIVNLFVTEKHLSDNQVK